MADENCEGYEPDLKYHHDDWDDPGKAGEAKKVINTAHILHFAFPELLDQGGFPTVINLIGGMLSDPKNPNHDVVYAHGYVPNEVLALFRNPEDHPKVTVTASKVYSYYCGYTPFSHGITFRSAVINGHASLLRYNGHSSPCKQEVKDDEIIKENEKLWALFNIVRGMFGSEDRWYDTRRPFKDEEVRRVPVLRVEIDKSTSRLHERLGIMGYQADWETSDGRKYWEGAIPMWETYGDPIKGKTDRAFPDYLNKVFSHRRESNEQVAVEEAMKPFVPKN